MRRMKAILLCVVAGILMPATTVHAHNRAAGATPGQVAVPLSGALLDRLPAEWRDPVRGLVTLTPERQQQLLTASDEELRVAVVSSLSSSSRTDAMDFLLAVVDKEPSPKVRVRIISSWLEPHWRTNPKVYPVLESLIATDPNADIAIRSLEILRRIRMEAMDGLLTRRLELAKSKGDQESVRLLAREKERWISLERGTMLPEFLRLSPPLFSLSLSGKTVRVVALGDYGTGQPQQKQVAAAMLQHHRRKRFDFGITLGDNFYPVGMASPTDPRWPTQWEQLYGPLGIKYYATLGNHDWAQPDSPAAEILYSDKSATWRMPAPYYTFVAGPVQFFALDTNEISEAQVIWLKEELARSQARWKVVYGHHHIYSATRGDNRTLITQLLPVLRGQADIYICGHDHNLQHVRPEGGVHFFVSGGGGAGTYKTIDYERTIFKKETYGFTTLEADEQQIRMTMIDLNGEQLYEYVLKK